MAQQGLSILAITLLGGLLPLFFRRSDRGLHLLVAFTTGIFLGTLFLHMLPQVAELADGWPAVHAGDSADPGSDGEGAFARTFAHAHEATFGDGNGPTSSGDDARTQDSRAGHSATVWIFVLLGVLTLFLLEHLVIKAKDRPGQGHLAVGYASLVGLSMHALTSGFGLAAASHLPGVQTPLFLSILSHKAAESFSLTTVFLLAGFRRRRILVLLLLFALVTPLGMVSGDLMLSQVQGSLVTALTAFAVGTFLFVALYDLLPEVFHHRVDALKKIVLLLAGIGLTLVMHA